MGGGIWAMHFVAMLAFTLPVQVNYAPELTALSLALPVVASGFGFALVSRSAQMRLSRLAVAGLVMGSGIAAMHYSGMAAMRMPAAPTYDAVLVAASVLIAVGAATVALWLAFRGTTLPIRAAAAVCMGMAVAAMHYTAMEALTFKPSDAGNHNFGTSPVGESGLAIWVTAITFLILLLALGASLVDRRLAAMSEREAVALRESEESFRSLYRSTPLPLHALDAQGRVTQVSEAWLELLGRRREEVLGSTLTSFMSRACAERRDREEWPALLERGELRDVECEFLTNDGRSLSVLLSARVQSDTDGRFLRTLEGMVDITARRQAEEALRHAQKMEAVGQLTGGVAHDFNNLLTAILGSLTLLERHVEDGERPRRLLNTAHQAVKRGADLSQSLLAFSRKQPLRETAVDVNDLLRETTSLLRRAVGEAITLKLDLAAGLPPCRADATQLQTAVLNLAINARDAMQQDRRLTLCTALRVLGADELAANSEANPGTFVAVSVEDSGHGMTPEILARAFEPFFTTKEVGKGTGLGLSQVYGFVRQLEGHVTIDSAPGRGTTVTLFLPLAEAEQDLPHPTPKAAPAERHPATQGAVLVVEDDQDVLEATAEVLRDAGWSVLTALHGQEALALLETHGARLDVMLTDVVMPGSVSGVELAFEARQRWPQLGILLTSGYPGPFQQSLPPWAGLLPKPYDRADLLTRLSQLTLRGRKASSRA